MKRGRWKRYVSDFGGATTLGVERVIFYVDKIFIQKQ